VRRFGLGCIALVVLAGCSSGSDQAATPSPTTASPTASPTPSPTPPATPKPTPVPPAVNPLTGLRGVPKQRVVVVKIDDTASGRPQIGLESADIVYVEQVEAGLTRLAAVFASRHPTVVGPVRSVRNADPELLATYGRPALAYSGGAAGPVGVLRRSPVLDAGPQRVGAAYRRLGSRSAPYNLVVDTGRIATAAVGASSVRDIGLRWAAIDPALAKARRVGMVSVTVGRTVLRFRWSGPARAWLQLNPDGSYRRTASGRPIATPNLVVPFSPAHIDRSDVDVVGNPSVYTSTIGSGQVLVFRDGRVLGGRWSRSRANGPTAYLDAARKPLTLRPGGAWVLLAATGAPVSMS
jgi:Protein of unknown function (DUF3048) N-terminal domain/Protein of unknown function (DUF3048) C-terminal domain